MALVEAAGALAALGVYAFGIEPRRLVTRRHRITWRSWSPGPGPSRIAVLSDIHAAWPHITPGRLARIVRHVLALRPRLVLLPGDFVVTDTWGAVPVAPERIAEVLQPLAERVPTCAVLGNHDYDFDGERVAAALSRCGIRVLANEAVPLSFDGRRLWLAGLDDPVTLRADLDATIAQLPEDEPAVLLSHSPDVHTFAPPNVRLVVAGHTHGGQVCLPLLGPVITMSRLPRRQAHGLHEADGRHLFVTGGIGTTGLPVRFLQPPEVGILDLVPAVGEAEAVHTRETSEEELAGPVTGAD